MNHPVYVYDANATDLTTTGLAGDLRPIEATFTEEKNGLAEVIIRIPYDKQGKWKHAAVVGNLIKCEVPVRMPPVIEDDEYADTVQVGE